jgi:hypothetical protein
VNNNHISEHITETIKKTINDDLSLHFVKT